MRYLLLAVAIVVGSCGQASAWGKAGHKIVCAVAFRLAAPATQAEIRRLMRIDPEFSAFEDSCSWPDHPRQRSSEHIVHVPRSSTRLDADCPLAGKCVVAAIRHDLGVLAAKSSSDHDKLAALKFLAHWVGDVHQPLHVAFKDDRVGVGIAVAGECAGNLHAAWDTCLVTKTLGNDAARAASEIAGMSTPAGRKQWSSSGPRDWANESLVIARDAATKYCVRRGRACEPPTGPVVVDAAYVSRNGTIVRDRLVRAGVRLARLLDSALGR